MPQRYFEDFHSGDVLPLGERAITKDEIIAYASVYDAQPFHIDEDAAKKLMLGGLAASGWHTACSIMRMNYDSWLKDTASLGAPGIDELRWTKPVRLHLLIPAVENAVSGAAFRPGDVLKSRKGLTVEIGNTDAEGRLILADALALADEEEPDLLFDFATLTGAARIALGPDLPPMYSDDDALAAACLEHSRKVHDPIWRMPLWMPYDKQLDGKFSDLVNVSSGPLAGSITAALFLRRFVERAKAWAHFDVYAWTPKPLPGRPEGGEVQVARLLFSMLANGYAQKRR